MSGVNYDAILRGMQASGDPAGGKGPALESLGHLAVLARLLRKGLSDLVEVTQEDVAVLKAAKIGEKELQEAGCLLKEKEKLKSQQVKLREDLQAAQVRLEEDRRKRDEVAQELEDTKRRAGERVAHPSERVVSAWGRVAGARAQQGVPPTW